MFAGASIVGVTASHRWGALAMRGAGEAMITALDGAAEAVQAMEPAAQAAVEGFAEQGLRLLVMGFLASVTGQRQVPDAALSAPGSVPGAPAVPSAFAGPLNGLLAGDASTGAGINTSRLLARSRCARRHVPGNGTAALYVREQAGIQVGPFGFEVDAAAALKGRLLPRPMWVVEHIGTTQRSAAEAVVGAAERVAALASAAASLSRPAAWSLNETSTHASQLAASRARLGALNARTQSALRSADGSNGRLEGAGRGITFHRLPEPASPTTSTTAGVDVVRSALAAYNARPSRALAESVADGVEDTANGRLDGQASQAVRAGFVNNVESIITALSTTVPDGAELGSLLQRWSLLVSAERSSAAAAEMALAIMAFGNESTFGSCGEDVSEAYARFSEWVAPEPQAATRVRQLIADLASARPNASATLAETRAAGVWQAERRCNATGCAPASLVVGASSAGHASFFEASHSVLLAAEAARLSATTDLPIGRVAASRLWRALSASDLVASWTVSNATLPVQFKSTVDSVLGRLRTARVSLLAFHTDQRCTHDGSSCPAVGQSCAAGLGTCETGVRTCLRNAGGLPAQTSAGRRVACLQHQDCRDEFPVDYPLAVCNLHAPLILPGVEALRQYANDTGPDLTAEEAAADELRAAIDVVSADGPLRRVGALALLNASMEALPLARLERTTRWTSDMLATAGDGTALLNASGSTARVLNDTGRFFRLEAEAVGSVGLGASQAGAQAALAAEAQVPWDLALGPMRILNGSVGDLEAPSDGDAALTSVVSSASALHTYVSETAPADLATALNASWLRDQHDAALREGSSGVVEALQAMASAVQRALDASADTLIQPQLRRVFAAQNALDQHKRFLQVATTPGFAADNGGIHFFAMLLQTLAPGERLTDIGFNDELLIRWFNPLKSIVVEADAAQRPAEATVYRDGPLLRTGTAAAITTEEEEEALRRWPDGRLCLTRNCLNNTVRHLTEGDVAVPFPSASWVGLTILPVQGVAVLFLLQLPPLCSAAVALFLVGAFLFTGSCGRRSAVRWCASLGAAWSCCCGALLLLLVAVGPLPALLALADACGSAEATVYRLAEGEAPHVCHMMLNGSVALHSDMTGNAADGAGVCAVHVDGAAAAVDVARTLLATASTAHPLAALGLATHTVAASSAATSAGAVGPSSSSAASSSLAAVEPICDAPLPLRPAIDPWLGALARAPASLLWSAALPPGAGAASSSSSSTSTSTSTSSLSGTGANPFVWPASSAASLHPSLTGSAGNASVLGAAGPFYLPSAALQGDPGPMSGVLTASADATGSVSSVAAALGAASLSGELLVRAMARAAREAAGRRSLQYAREEVLGAARGGPWEARRGLEPALLGAAAGGGGAVAGSLAAGVEQHLTCSEGVRAVKSAGDAVCGSAGQALGWLVVPLLMNGLLMLVAGWWLMLLAYKRMPAVLFGHELDEAVNPALQKSREGGDGTAESGKMLEEAEAAAAVAAAEATAGSGGSGGRSGKGRGKGGLAAALSGRAAQAEMDAGLKARAGGVAVPVLDGGARGLALLGTAPVEAGAYAGDKGSAGVVLPAAAAKRYAVAGPGNDGAESKLSPEDVHLVRGGSDGRLSARVAGQPGPWDDLGGALREGGLETSSGGHAFREAAALPMESSGGAQARRRSGQSTPHQDAAQAAHSDAMLAMLGGKAT
ncbi:hypothetical protein FNF29_06388 [Cafeteria roenbergensis]|uniref:Uncharacterized protein n=1 Tax=Cafeteria roenbergensis TaxID=33653 RepID=A0A5A8C8I1_CAFRO|nr:hypothetical protein FNF29_06388 [Cafeteria roenbergensis]|eukprot:KAA0148914.1 hypothetical protein FNF29_06388 [Cafeteria roenbergensis]